LDKATRTTKRQAVPFSKGPPKDEEHEGQGVATTDLFVYFVPFVVQSTFF
jgi:hypothetical protein